jgi:murein DD-endopeptidase MepM/ murein hydrolase activator NlpD
VLRSVRPRSRSIRGTARGKAAGSTAVVAALLLSLLGASPAAALTPAPAHLPQTPRVDITRQVVDLTFPVAGPQSDLRFIDDFLYLRGGGSRLHAATDVMAPKHRPVHAAVGGTIGWIPVTEPSYGWMMDINGDDGHRYSYVHLNNDTPTRDANGKWLDDDKGGMKHAYAPRIVTQIEKTGTARGLRVERGELIGWVGDSGNAKGVAPHLHFEIHARDSTGEYRINPYDSLLAARNRGDVPGAVTPVALRRFSDVGASATHAAEIERLAEEGIVTGCTSTLYCPGKDVTRGDLAAYVAAARGLDTSAVTTARFSDVPLADRNAAAIHAVADAKILTGFNDGTFRPDQALQRDQLASMLVRAFGVPAVSTAAPFTDVPVTATHAANIAATEAVGLTRGCGNGRYCGGDPVRRDQIASFLFRAWDAPGW